MVYSMTGLGIGEAETDSRIIRVELKSVNSRFLEISCRLPSGLNRREQDIRDILRKSLSRGKIYVQVTIQNEHKGALDLKVKPDSVAMVLDMLNQLRDEAGLNEPVTLDHILKFSEIFEPAQESEDGEELWDDLVAALKEALKQLKDMRLMEGASLVEDIEKRLRILEKDLSEIEKISVGNSSLMFDRLYARVEKLLHDSDLEPERLKTEIALLADKSDITEECVRLKSHFKLFRHTFAEEETTGKKLNFLVQELNREVNTIGSKSADSRVSHLCVNMKGEIEKIREQIQNLE